MLSPEIGNRGHMIASGTLEVKGDGLRKPNKKHRCSGVVLAV